MIVWLWRGCFCGCWWLLVVVVVVVVLVVVVEWLIKKLLSEKRTLAKFCSSGKRHIPNTHHVNLR